MGIRPAGVRNSYQKKEEMKKLTAVQWQSLLYKFTADEDFRPGIQKPFMQGGYICATNAYIVLRVNRKLIPPSNDDYVPKGYVPNVTAVMPNPNPTPTFTITIKAIRECLVALGLNYDILTKNCPECDGSGDVDWYYTDRDGDTHTMVDKCPCCDGMGEVANGDDRYCAIGDRATLAHFMILTHYVMNSLGIETLKCTWGKGNLLFNLSDGVDILVATVPIPESKRSFPIKIEEL